MSGEFDGVRQPLEIEPEQLAKKDKVKPQTPDKVEKCNG